MGKKKVFVNTYYYIVSEGRDAKQKEQIRFTQQTTIN